MSSYNLVILRHGQSQWNLENRFTGWVDVDLSSKGQKEAQQAADALNHINFYCDIAFTSVLKRAIHTLWLVLEEMNRVWVPVVKSWRLNERHYGALTGLNKEKVAEEYGAQQLHLWRRSYTVCPPKQDAQIIVPDDRYKDVKIPSSESLQETEKRVLPFWNEVAVPALSKKQRVLIVAHGNSLRALIKHIEHISDEKISEVNVPTGVPIAYTLQGDDFHLKDKKILIHTPSL